MSHHRTLAALRAAAAPLGDCISLVDTKDSDNAPVFGPDLGVTCGDVRRAFLARHRKDSTIRQMKTFVGPLARLLMHLDGDKPDDTVLIQKGGRVITYGQVRKAAELLGNNEASVA